MGRGIWVGGKKPRTDTQARTNRHTHKAKPKHPRYVGCNKPAKQTYRLAADCTSQFFSSLR